MDTNYQKYLAIWTDHYSKTEFGGTSTASAAAYAAMDCMNISKNWDQATIDDDIAYWTEKLAK